VETSISVKLLVDASGSMNHSDGDFKKIEYARFLAASLAYLANLYGDAVGLNVFSNGKVYLLPSKQDHQHLARLFYQLENINPQGSFTNPVHYKEIFSGSQKRELLIFITDFYQQDAEIFRLIDSLSMLKHEIIVFHLLAKNELELDYKGYNSLEDLETGEIIRIDSTASRKAYQQRMQDYLGNLRMQLLDRHIFYRMISTDQPLDQALRDFLNQRNKSSF
jgi:uncharacterized protein (DUF58 family)